MTIWISRVLSFFGIHIYAFWDSSCLLRQLTSRVFLHRCILLKIFVLLRRYLLVSSYIYSILSTVLGAFVKFWKFKQCWRFQSYLFLFSLSLGRDRLAYGNQITCPIAMVSITNLFDCVIIIVVVTALLECIPLELFGAKYLFFPFFFISTLFILFWHTIQIWMQISDWKNSNLNCNRILPPKLDFFLLLFYFFLSLFLSFALLVLYIIGHRNLKYLLVKQLFYIFVILWPWKLSFDN